jgi:hypothetical protein
MRSTTLAIEVDQGRTGMTVVRASAVRRFA